MAVVRVEEEVLAALVQDLMALVADLEVLLEAIRQESRSVAESALEAPDAHG